MLVCFTAAAAVVLLPFDVVESVPVKLRLLQRKLYMCLTHERSLSFMPSQAYWTCFEAFDQV